jgi:Helix-turn-helix domain
VVPHRFLHRYARLRPALTQAEALFVLHLMTFKWDRELPYPTYKTLALRMGVTDKMVRRYAQSLDRKGYLRRHYKVKAANRFDLTGLFEALSRAWLDDHPSDSLSEEISLK